MKSILGKGSQFTFTTRVLDVYSEDNSFCELTTPYIAQTQEEGSGCTDEVSGINTYRNTDFLPLSDPIIHFQGAHFDTKVSHSIPVEVLGGKTLPKFEQLTAFLMQMEKSNLFGSNNKRGTVMHIDD